MDIQDHTKTTTTPSGHDESHGVHICHRCGWPFPNSHPSSKHRRAHKRVCGTIEGYTKLIHSEPVSDDEHHSDEDIVKTPSPMIEKMIVKESGSSAGGIEKKSSRSEEDLFSDAATEFSDSGISPGPEERFSGTTKLLDSPIDSELEDFRTPDTHAKDADKTEETYVNTISNTADIQIKLSDSDTKPSVPLVEDKNGSHEDKVIDLVDTSNTVETMPDSAKVMDEGEESVYVLSVTNDIPIVDHAETLLQDFKDHKTVSSNEPLIRDPVGDKDVESMPMVDDTFEIKTVEERIEESQISKKGKPMDSEHMNTDLSAVVPTFGGEEAKVAETRPLEMSKTVTESTDNLTESEVSHDKHFVATPDEKTEIVAEERASYKINQEKLESDQKVSVLEKCLEADTQETVKEPETVVKSEKKIVESVGNDSKGSGNIGISQVSEKPIVEKAEEECNVSRVISETVVDEGDGKVLTSQDCGVDASVGSSSRNSVEGNWGSVSVLSTASYDVENAPSIGKPDIAADKSQLGKADALVEVKEETVDQKASEIKKVTVQNSHPPKSEGNETEGRKRNEEAIAKVTNWSTGEHTKQLSTMIQKDVAAEKTSEPEKSSLTTPPVNQESSPPKYIDEEKKVRKKAKGKASWIPFVCCSSVNVS